MPQDPHPPPLEQLPVVLPQVPHEPVEHPPLQPPFAPQDPHTESDSCSFKGTWIITPLSSITSTDSFGTLIETTLPCPPGVSRNV
ncbi:MAG TPA: hypothetical protein VE843_09590, partial [Ktedonobacteraceae bacterium]|nr:hypothetical protein [Ktedonobacteraceae bacterium]